MERKKVIRVKRENVERMAEAHRVSVVTVYNALAFRSDSPTAKVIRKQAVELWGGVEDMRIVF